MQKYLSSGILELYVFGALSEKESEEITSYVKQYSEIKKEVEEIEKSLLQLSAAIAPHKPDRIFEILKTNLIVSKKRFIIKRRLTA